MKRFGEIWELDSRLVAFKPNIQNSIDSNKYSRVRGGRGNSDKTEYLGKTGTWHYFLNCFKFSRVVASIYSRHVHYFTNKR